MEILLLERLAPEAQAWLQARHRVAYRPELAEDAAALRRQVYNVQAMVLPDDILGNNLLGMAFLSRLKRYEVAGGRLVMEQ